MHQAGGRHLMGQNMIMANPQAQANILAQKGIGMAPHKMSLSSNGHINQLATVGIIAPPGLSHTYGTGYYYYDMPVSINGKQMGLPNSSYAK